MKIQYKKRVSILIILNKIIQSVGWKYIDSVFLYSVFTCKSKTSITNCRLRNKESNIFLGRKSKEKYQIRFPEVQSSIIVVSYFLWRSFENIWYTTTMAYFSPSFLFVSRVDFSIDCVLYDENNFYYFRFIYQECWNAPIYSTFLSLNSSQFFI